MGCVRKEIDAKRLLSSNFRIRQIPATYKFIESFFIHVITDGNVMTRVVNSIYSER